MIYMLDQLKIVFYSRSLPRPQQDSTARMFASITAKSEKMAAKSEKISTLLLRLRVLLVTSLYNKDYGKHAKEIDRVDARYSRAYGDNLYNRQGRRVFL